MTEPDSNSAELVRRSQTGDGQALDHLVVRHLPWIQGFVRRRLGMNGFGLHDVIGNLFEWCRDRQGLFSFPVTGGDSERIVDAETSSSRIFRGGSAFSEATEARTAFRLGFDPDVRQSILGLRASRALRN